VLRYGFHGLSYEYIASALPAHLPPAAQGRVIVAHLGNGASLCALKDGKSVATSMGFTALDGLMMGQRCGALDPGLVLHLIRHEGMSADEVEAMLYHDSGLLGVSGLSNAMQVLEASGTKEADEAITLFCDRAAAGIAALIPDLGGLDALVFTAGIGENSARVRAAICARLGWLGLELDAGANALGLSDINTPASHLALRVIPTDEEVVIARAARVLLPEGAEART
jgi:acetate kinase